MIINYPIHVIDFEGNTNSKIIEYGIVTIYNNELIYSKTGLINLYIKKDLKLIYLTFFKLRNSGLFAAHNASFENNIMKSIFTNIIIYNNFFLNKKNSFPTWGPWIDTYKIYKYIYPNLISYKLMDLINFFKLKKELDYLSEKICNEKKRKPHNALYDSISCSLLIKNIINKKLFNNKLLYNLYEYKEKNQLKIQFN